MYMCDYHGTFFQKYSTLFNVHNLRTSQLRAIHDILNGAHVMLLLPTGGGKTSTYCIPNLILNSIALVILPLVAIIRTQVTHLSMRNVSVR